MPEPAEVWITGIGLASSLGEGLDANWEALQAGRVNTDEKTFAPYVVHRHRLLWENPDGFDPSRFLPGARDAIDPFAYLPFGRGPRG